MMNTSKLDMRALKVGQQVILTDALPGLRDGATGVVTEVTKWHVSVQAEARVDGVDGWYAVEFSYDGRVAKHTPWIDASMPGWDGPVHLHDVPGLRIIDIKEDAA